MEMFSPQAGKKEEMCWACITSAISCLTTLPVLLQIQAMSGISLGPFESKQIHISFPTAVIPLHPYLVTSMTKGRVRPSLPLALAGWRCGDSPLLSLFTPYTSLVLLLRAVQPCAGKAVCPVVLKGHGGFTIQTIVIKQITNFRKQSAAFLEVSTDTLWCPAEH